MPARREVITQLADLSINAALFMLVQQSVELFDLLLVGSNLLSRCLYFPGKQR
jgi:hypothetical protein